MSACTSHPDVLTFYLANFFFFVESGNGSKKHFPLAQGDSKLFMKLSVSFDKRVCMIESFEFRLAQACPESSFSNAAVGLECL